MSDFLLPVQTEVGLLVKCRRSIWVVRHGAGLNYLLVAGLTERKCCAREGAALEEGGRWSDERHREGRRESIEVGSAPIAVVLYRGHLILSSLELDISVPANKECGDYYRQVTGC